MYNFRTLRVMDEQILLLNNNYHEIWNASFTESLGCELRAKFAKWPETHLILSKLSKMTKQRPKFNFKTSLRRIFKPDLLTVNIWNVTTK